MPTVLDELLVETRVSLEGLRTGIRAAEVLAAQAKGKLAQELAPTTFLVNTSEAVSQISALSAATTQLHASLTLLRAQLAQPFKVSIDTSELRRAAADVRAMNAAMAGAEQTTRTTRTRRSPTTEGIDPGVGVGTAVVLRSNSGTPTPIIVSGPVTMAGGGGGMVPSARGGIVPSFASSGGAIIPPAGSSIAIIPPSARGFGGYSGGPTITMPPGSYAGGTFGSAMPPPWAFTGFGGGSTGAFGRQFVNPGLQWGQQFVPSGQAARFTPLTPATTPAAAGMGLLGSIGTTIAYAAAFGAVFKIVSDIRDVWQEVIEGGTQFNAEMERGTINIAALLSQTREFRSASGQTVDTFTNYKLQLGAAANIQKELVRLDAETLGTIQDLQGVFAQVLAHGRGQVATDTQRLTLATAILNASVLMGNTQQQHVIETRQTLLGQSHVGNVILANLGISNRQIQAWREQGVLVERLLERLELFNRLGKDAGQTWDGLTNSFKSLSSLTAGMVGGDLFEGRRRALSAQVDEMRRQQESGAVFAMPLTASTQEMETYGRNMAHVWLAVDQAIIGLQNSFTTMKVRAVNAAFEVAAAWQRAKEALMEWVPESARPFVGDFSSPGEAGSRAANWLLGTPAGTLPDDGRISSAADVENQTNRLAIRLNSLSGADTSLMSQASFSQFLMALQQGQDETNKLRDAANQLHGMNQITEADWKKLTKDLGTLNVAYSKTIAQFEHQLPGTKEVDDKAAREAERLMDRRESATRGADSAELSLQQRIASITGETVNMQVAAEQKIEDARKEGIREAFGDATIIAAVNRKAAADRAALEIDATQRFIQNSRREDAIAEESAQRQLRASQIVFRGKQQLAEAELTSIRRRIRIAEEQGAPPAVMNALFEEERAAIERNRVLGVQQAQEEQAAAQRQVEIQIAKIAALDQEIAKVKELKDLQTTWTLRQPGDVNAPFISTTTGAIPIGVGGANTELLTDRRRQLNDVLLTQQARAQAAGDAMVKADERATSETDRLIEAKQRLNMTIGERVGERLREDANRSADTFADLTVRGIYRVSDALSDMASKGKFSFRTLAQAANETMDEINRELMRAAFRQLLGIPGGGQGAAQFGAEGGLIGALFGGSSKGTFGNVTSGGSSTATQLATTGIQQIAQTGTTATQMLTQASSSSFQFLSSLAQTIITSIQAIAVGSGGGGGGILGFFGGLFGGGAPDFGNVTSGGSSTAGGGFGGVISGGSSTAAFGFERGGFIPHFASGGFAGNEVPAILHKGEMVLSAAETRNLMRYGSAKLPIGGGAGSARSHGGGGHTIINMTVNTPDGNSFRRNYSQIEAEMTRRANASRRNL